MRAIDLYSGVGGWSLGLALAGIEVVSSYEKFEPANLTNRKNNGHDTVNADIRALDFLTLPAEIDLVVGSPPCTQFSFSNRGGGGDLADGLKDIRCFLSVVDHLNPSFWAMENVPRIADIVTREMRPGGELEDFAHLDAKVAVVNMEDWGLPQRRKRCVVGNFDLDLLASYAKGIRKRTLGEIVRSLSQEMVIDPLYGLSMPRSEVVDHVKEAPLNEEESRVNCASKVSHPVYNAMPFPDPLDRSARTITATCTRVSRESIVISDPASPATFRRLTLRERAMLQGFPLSFQFFGSSHGQKATMIGNAVPPLFAYYVANACQAVAVDDLEPLERAVARFAPTLEIPPITRVDLAGGRYRADRTFRLAIPGFNFKSGVRFELSNKKRSEFPAWGVTFYFGSSKDIRSLELTGQTFRTAVTSLPTTTGERVSAVAAALAEQVRAADIKRMQDVWTRRGPGGTRPFDFIDKLASYASEIESIVNELDQDQKVLTLAQILRSEYGDAAAQLPGLMKLVRLAPSIIAGTIMGALVNSVLEPSRPASIPKGKARVAYG